MTEKVTEKHETMENNRIEYVDVLRVLSALSVVFLHTASGSVWKAVGSPVWHLANVLTGIMSISVPLFFMISGAMTMSSKKTLSLEYTYKKRLTKMLVPFLTWSVVAVLYYQIPNLMSGEVFDWKAAVKKLAYLPGQAVTVHLWFMYALIPLYILSPVLKKLVDSMTENLIKYVFALWIVFSSVLPTAASFLPVKYQPVLKLNSQFDLNFMNGYLGYFLAGYYLFIYNKRISKKLLAGIIVIDVAVISLGTWWKSVEGGAYSEIFKTYPRLFILVLSVAVFLLAKELLYGRRLPVPVSNALQVFSMASFGVYLVHNLVVHFVSEYIFGLWPANSMLILIAAYLLILFVSLAIIVVLSSIKLTCFMFTGMPFKDACRTCNIQYFFNKCLKFRTLSYYEKV